MVVALNQGLSSGLSGYAACHSALRAVAAAGAAACLVHASAAPQACECAIMLAQAILVYFRESSVPHLWSTPRPPCCRRGP